MRHDAIPLVCKLTLIHSGWYEMHFHFHSGWYEMHLNLLSVKPVFMGAK